MLSSIHPLGERARSNNWMVTVTSFTAAAVVAAAFSFGLVGWLGSALVESTDQRWALVVTGGAALVAAALDLFGVLPPGPHRQVNETWIGSFRGWVYGGAFGGQLGVGLATYVVTWGVYASYLAAFATGSGLGGAIVGGAFALGRSILVLSSFAVDRPARLTGFNRATSRLAKPVSFLAPTALLLIGAVFLLGAL